MQQEGGEQSALCLYCNGQRGGTGLLTGPAKQNKSVWWQCQMTPMALAGTILLWEQDGNPPRIRDRNLPRISWIHRALIQQMSSLANSRWCNTNRVQVSTGMLTEGTNLQDTSLEPSFPFLEPFEGQTPAHSLVGAQHTHTHCQHTRKHLRAHTQQSVCSHLICLCEHSVCHPNECADHAHTHLHSHVHAAMCTQPIIHPCCFLTQGEGTCCHHNTLWDPSAAKLILALA